MLSTVFSNMVDRLRLEAGDINDLALHALRCIQRIGWRLGAEGLIPGFDTGKARQAEEKVGFMHLDLDTVLGEPRRDLVHGTVHIGRMFALVGRKALHQSPGFIQLHRSQNGRFDLVHIRYSPICFI